jgi:hypothetical protein
MMPLADGKVVRITDHHRFTAAVCFSFNGVFVYFNFNNSGYWLAILGQMIKNFK